MLITTVFALLSFTSFCAALPTADAADAHRDVNPFVGKHYFANSNYANELNQTVAAFLAKNDSLNAARTRTVQKTGTFVRVTTVSGLSLINQTVSEARKEQRKTHKKQIIELVLYNLPDRDCSAGESSGEFSLANNGLELYKHSFVDPYAATLKAAWDLDFAIILEPDSLGNVITNQNVPLCANASSAYEEGIAYAIAKLQAPNIALYIDAAHGGWLGWDGNLPLAAAEFSKVVTLASNFTAGAKIRGFSTDVSNYNPYIANPRANYTQYSNSYDELHYAESLAPYLTNVSLPAHFIIDQGRSGLQNTRTTWGDWCNVEAGFGIRPTTNTNSSLVDSIVWVKPGGESDGACGPTIDGEAAPVAGLWWEAYVEALVKNAEPPLAPTWGRGWH
ncbi:glycoside hydrolase family 6 protein [Mollisia scopiformis]|uniref:Glucanase n=1 Tax=Mollisia scopiformis TaxID=149040 RepID=A0A132B270_MOLSC|nr:glycoside hydrolase family 6 protein [Mollisia scopiformis]KUJ06411.1 glycoside hydrolase family 6 protein [Mollisia scopiformis]